MGTSPHKQNPATWWDWGRRGHFKEEVYFIGTFGAITECPRAPTNRGRAGNGIRTRDINLGKVALYQLSYSRIGIANITNHPFLCKHFSGSKGDYCPMRSAKIYVCLNSKSSSIDNSFCSKWTTGTNDLVATQLGPYYAWGSLKEAKAGNHYRLISRILY